MLSNEYIRSLLRARKDRTGIRWEEVAEKADIPLPTLQKFIYNQTGAMTVQTLAKVLDGMGMELVILDKESGKRC